MRCLNELKIEILVAEILTGVEPTEHREAFTLSVGQVLRLNGAAGVVVSNLTFSPGVVQAFHGCFGQAPNWLGWDRVVCDKATFILLVDVCSSMSTVISALIDSHLDLDRRFISENLHSTSEPAPRRCLYQRHAGSLIPESSAFDFQGFTQEYKKHVVFPWLFNASFDSVMATASGMDRRLQNVIPF